MRICAGQSSLSVMKNTTARKRFVHRSRIVLGKGNIVVGGPGCEYAEETRRGVCVCVVVFV